MFDRYMIVFDYVFFFFFFFHSFHTATPSLEDYEKAYIVHTGFARWKPTSNHVNYCMVLKLQMGWLSMHGGGGGGRGRGAPVKPCK